MVAMILVAAEANNDGNNINWLFVVVLRVSAVLLLDVSWSKEIKEVELNKRKNVIHNNTFIQRNSHEDSLSVEESTSKARFVSER